MMTVPPPPPAKEALCVHGTEPSDSHTCLNQQRTINLADAADTTANRIDGATAANNKKWVARQSAVLAGYKKQEAALLAALPTLLKREKAQLDKAGYGQLTVSAQDVRSLEDTVSNSGLPAAIVTTLTRLGVDSTTQAKIRQALFAQDTSAASGTYDSILDNAALEATALSASTALRKK